MKSFKAGDKVRIHLEKRLNPESIKYHGRTGTVMGKAWRKGQLHVQTNEGDREALALYEYELLPLSPLYHPRLIPKRKNATTQI